jgi:hypothetical protein
MEAVAALGVAAAAFQFFDAGAKVLVLCKQIRDSEKGTTEANHEREHHIDVLKNICSNLRYEIPPGTADREIMMETRDECVKIGKEMLRLLNSFKPSSQSWCLCFRAAYRAMRGDKKIRDLQARLAASQTNFHTAVSVETLNGVEDLLKLQGKINDSLRIMLNEIREARIESARNHERTHEQVAELAISSSAAHDTTQTQLHNIQQDQQVLQTATQSVQTTLTGAEVTAKRDAVLKSLKYEIFDRQQSIKPPSPGTFEWIFDDSPPREGGPEQDEHARSREHMRGQFARWLRSDDETTFWISGKAGSGKSSLMTFIRDDPRTKNALSTRAGGQKLYEFYFYFWRPGSALQKSIYGLLRSLLFQLAGAKRAVFDLILSMRSTPYNGWTTTALLDALRRSLDAFQGDRVFLMVDGLDEFDGEYTELLDLLLQWRNRSYIKMCLANRPETAILVKLGALPTIRLQDLNDSDISKYVRDELEPYCALPETLVRELIFRAEGVFLWAVLVVNSMITGCLDNDDAATLQSRLHDTPTELNALFAQLLSGVHKRHQEPLSLCLFHLNEENSWGECLFQGRVCLIAASLPLCQDINSTDDFLDACTRTSATLVAQWKGLIEIK